MKQIKLTSVKKVKNTSKRYDIQVQNSHNFFANNMLIHNSMTAIAYDPRTSDNNLMPMLAGSAFAYSKGLGDKGLVFKNISTNSGNIYHKTLIDYAVSLENLANKFSGQPVHVFGETFGKGVQDLQYGLTNKAFRVFDIYVGTPGQGHYLNADIKYDIARNAGFDTVPELYRGKFCAADIATYRDTQDPIGKQHIQEGIVITPINERYDSAIGRVILKSINPAYLIRKSKNATEYN